MSNTKPTSSSASKQDPDAASMLSTSSFSSTVSLVKASLKAKAHLPSSLSKEQKKLEKEQKKLEKEERKTQSKEKGPVQWMPDINGDNKTGEFLTSLFSWR